MLAPPAFIETMLTETSPLVSVTSALGVSTPRVVEKLTCCPTTGAPACVHRTVTVRLLLSGISASAAGARKAKLSLDIAICWVATMPRADAVSVSSSCDAVNVNCAAPAESVTRLTAERRLPASVARFTVTFGDARPRRVNELHVVVADVSEGEIVRAGDRDLRADHCDSDGVGERVACRRSRSP
jgi:hypothetical protein